MEIFHLSEIADFPYEQRVKNVFYQSDEFKVRIIVLQTGGEIPLCEMSESVIFYVLEGNVEVKVNAESAILKENHCLITEPATISMKSKNGARLMGIQIAINKTGG